MRIGNTLAVVLGAALFWSMAPALVAEEPAPAPPSPLPADESLPHTFPSVDQVFANPVSEEAAAGPAAGGCCDSLSCCPDGGCCDPDKAFNVGFWLTQGFTWNPDSPANRFNGPVTFNDRANEYMLNQLYLFLEKPINADGRQWEVGGRVDLLWGEDSRFTKALGLELEQDGTERWNSETRRFYQFAMPQFYVEVGVPVGNGLSVKAGHFYTIIGYEGVMAPYVFFQSHPYTHQYGEPFTHTGIVASYNVSDRVVAQGGIVRGWDNFDDNNDHPSFLGGFNWTSCDEKTNLLFTWIVGPEQAGNNDNNRFLYSVVLTRKVTDKLTYILQHDLGFEDDAAAGGADAEWYGFNNYLFYQINDCVTVGLRWEWFADDDGIRVAGQGAPHGIPLAAVPAHWNEVTLGLNIKPHDLVVIRPNVRWDWVDPLVPVPAGVGGGPFDDLTDRSQFLAGVDVIIGTY